MTLSTTLVFATLTHLNIRDGNLFLPPRVQSALESGLRMGLDLLIVMIVLIAIVAMVAVKYGPHHVRLTGAGSPTDQSATAGADVMPSAA